MQYMSTNFGVNSSSHILFETGHTQTQKVTDAIAKVHNPDTSMWHTLQLGRKGSYSSIHLYITRVSGCDNSIHQVL